MNLEKERELFEAWCSDRRLTVGPTHYCPHDKQVVFNNARTQDRFEVWQAAKSEAQADMRELVEVLAWMRKRWRKHETDEKGVVIQDTDGEEIRHWLDRVDPILAKHKGAHGG